MAMTVYKGKLVSCYYLRERSEYEPCNDGKSERLAGTGWDCEYGGEPDYIQCRNCPANPKVLGGKG